MILYLYNKPLLPPFLPCDIKSNHSIALLQAMNGLKNLMPRGIFAESNYSILKRRSEDFKRSINAFVEHLQQINKIYENYYAVFERNVGEMAACFPYDD